MHVLYIDIYTTTFVCFDRIDIEKENIDESIFYRVTVYYIVSFCYIIYYTALYDMIL